MMVSAVNNRWSTVWFAAQRSQDHLGATKRKL